MSVVAHDRALVLVGSQNSLPVLYVVSSRYSGLRGGTFSCSLRMNPEGLTTLVDTALAWGSSLVEVYLEDRREDPSRVVCGS